VIATAKGATPTVTVEAKVFVAMFITDTALLPPLVTYAYRPSGVMATSNGWLKSIADAPHRAGLYNAIKAHNKTNVRRRAKITNASFCFARFIFNHPLRFFLRRLQV
jgi:hypothetical protein